MKEGFFRKYFIQNLNWIIPSLWSIIEVIDYYFRDSIIAKQLSSTPVFWILTLLFVIYIIFVISKKFRNVELRLQNGSIIQISSNDIASYFKKKNIAFVFSSSNFFNTNPNIVAKELITKYLKRTNLKQRTIQKEIVLSLKSAKYEIIKNEKVTLNGNNNSYEPGSIASFKNKDKSHTVYLLAITKITAEGDSYSAKCEKEYIQTALTNVWKEVTKKERVDTICLPAIGSGLALAYNDANSSALDICKSYISYSVDNDIKVCQKLIITCNNREFNKERIVSALMISHPGIIVV